MKIIFDKASITLDVSTIIGGEILRVKLDIEMEFNAESKDIYTYLCGINYFDSLLKVV